MKKAELGTITGYIDRFKEALDAIWTDRELTQNYP
jgi:hypothetical protein